MKDFTNYDTGIDQVENTVINTNTNGNHAALAAIMIVIIAMAMMASIFWSVIKTFNVTLDLNMFKKNEELIKVEALAVEAQKEADKYPYMTRAGRQEYIERLLKEQGVDVEKYNLFVDSNGNVRVYEK